MKRFFAMFIITLAGFLPCATGCSSGAGGNAALDTNTIAQEYVDESDIEPFVPELPVSEQPEQKEQTKQPAPEQSEHKEQTEQLVPQQPEQIEQTAPEQNELELPEPEPPVPEQIEHKEQTEQLVPQQPEQIEQTAPEQTELAPPAPEPPVPEQGEDFVVSTEPKIVAAEYEFYILNENECSVRITNKTVVTKAVVPSHAEIEGKIYTVTEIDQLGFSSSLNLTYVSLSKTIKKIGVGAFARCIKLNRIDLANVEEIENCAFYICSELTVIIMPPTVKKIGTGAFARCAKLKRITLANVEEIGNLVLWNCPELAELIIPLSVKKIGTYILRDNNTHVKVRAQSDGEEWDEDWNEGNNGSVQYGGKYYQPIELDEVYDFDELGALNFD